MSFGNKSKKTVLAHMQLVVAWCFSEQACRGLSVKQDHGPSSVFILPILAAMNQIMATAGKDFLYMKIDLYVNVNKG